MPALLTHKAILLLARERLQRIKSLTGRMIDLKQVGSVPVPELERKVHALASLALASMNEASGASTGDDTIRTLTGAPDPDGTPVSRFAVMGAMGPDVPAFAEFFNAGQEWVFDTIHKGNPDYNRERVHAGTTDLALAIFDRAKTRGQTEVPAARQAGELDKVRAYVMGHLCHLAGDIISHPFINDLEWHPGRDGQEHREHGQNEVSIDAAVANKVFRRAGIRDGADWEGWWPAEDDLHPSFFGAYADAFKATYGDARRTSFKDYEDFLAKIGPADLSGDFIRHGYKTFRGFGVSVGYDWGYGHWFAMLILFALPLLALPLIASAMPHGKTFFEVPDGVDNPSSDRAGFELVSLPFQLTAPASAFFGGMLMPYSGRGAGGRAIPGLVMQVWSLATLLIGAIDGAANDDTPDKGIPGWARWVFFWLPQLFSSLIYAIHFLEDRFGTLEHARPFADKPGRRRQLINLINMLPLLPFALFGILLLVLKIVKATSDGENPSPIRRDGGWFIAITVIWMVLVLLFWFLVPLKLRNTPVPDTVDNSDPALAPHAVRLFDETTLWTDPAGDGARHYPSDLRPLAKLWWQGDGDMEIRSDRYGLTFRHSSGSTQTVPGPLAPMTTAEYLTFLTDTVTDGAGVTGGLHGAVFDSADASAAYVLPTGAAFAAHGDTATDEDDIAEGLAEFKDLGQNNDPGAYVLYHAPKFHQAIHLGSQGSFRPATELARRQAETGNAYTYIHDPLVDDADHSEGLMARAADLGALLCMGAAGHIATGATPADKVYQVFRNWSLDRRRVNEWRALVAGGALSDKEGAEDRYDAAMPAAPFAPADTGTWRAPVANAADATVLQEAVATAQGHGWVNVLRDWLDRVTEGEDLVSTATPRPGQPSNRALSRAMAYILDAPDPAGGP